MTRAVLRLRVRQAVGAMREAIADGVGDGVEHILGETRREVPLDEGTLERSGTASVDRATLMGAVSYDGPYARRQHEDLTYRHLPGRKAKYLEDPLLRSGAVFLDLVAARVRRATRG